MLNEHHQKRLSNVIGLFIGTYLILIVPSIGNVIHRGVRQKKQRVSLAGSLGVLKVGSYISPLSFYYLLYLEMINDLKLLKVSLKVGLKLSILTLIKKIEILLKGYTLSNFKLLISSNFKREKEL